MVKKNVKELIIKSAIGLFSEKGYKDTSIRDISLAADINSALIYYYFKNKEEVLYTIIESDTLELINLLNNIKKVEPDPLKCIEKMISNHTIFVSEHDKTTKIINNNTDQLSNDQNLKQIELQRKVYNIYMNELKNIKKAGLLKPVNLALLNFVILGMLNWFYRWYDKDGPLSGSELAEQMIDIVFRGALIYEQGNKQE